MENNYKKIIFLDIDGVMASIPYLNKGRGYVDSECVKRLNKLYDIGAEIVISSTWGEDADDLLKSKGLELNIIGHTEHFYTDWFCRGNEIEKWLVTNLGGMGTRYGLDRNGTPYYRKHYHKEDIDYEYVIFDDDTDFLLGQKDNFIHIDEYTGLTDEDIEKAIDILTRKN